MFDVKPKDKDDYYHLFGWLVSKRLAYMIIIVIGVVSASFLYGNRASIFGTGNEDGVKTFNYNSFALRLTTGDVRIKGQSGYLAYEGPVAKGKVTGVGTLYDIDGNTVYEGSFENNEYSGQGTRYFTNGNIWYQGSFLANKFDGQGVEYRQNGSKLYDGEYVAGMKQGNGSLYDNGNNLIYTGAFAMDEIQYSALLGKTATAISEQYTGERVLYEGSDTFDVYMPDINAFYVSSENDNALDDSMKVETVYVLSTTFPTKDGQLKGIKELKGYFGESIYEGYSDAVLSELLAMSFVRNTTGDIVYDDPGVMTSSNYDDYLSIDSYNDLTVYLYSFDQGGLRYTFVTRDKNQPFGFYYIDTIGGGLDDAQENNS